MLHITKSDAVNKLESLYGLPEKLVRQCDILLSALISVKAQNVKWDGKVRELEAADVSINQTLKHRSEELPGLMAACDKIKAQTEDKVLSMSLILLLVHYNADRSRYDERFFFVFQRNTSVLSIPV